MPIIIDEVRTEMIPDRPPATVEPPASPSGRDKRPTLLELRRQAARVRAREERLRAD